MLTQQYKKLFHRSQLMRYRQINPAEYFGHELTDILNQELSWIRQFGDFPQAKKLSIAILKLFVFVRSAVSKCKGFHTALRKEKYFIVELARRFRETIPVHKLSKLLGLNESTLRQWIREVRVSCSDSLINVCRRTHPNQLLAPELRKMKLLLTDESYRFWPLSSIYYHALKNKILSMSKSTWYKYAQLLSIKRLKPRTVKIKTTGIRAAAPNELWHADVTYFYTPDKIRLYIYTVIDNFSRFPLYVKVSEKLSGATRVETFRTALKKATEINPASENLLLMTDGGSENYNQNVSDFIENANTIHIRQIKALSDGWPSNSMVEAFHYVIKIFYLNNMDIRNITAMNKAIENLLWMMMQNTTT
jgi:putative transposase